ncbi:MAG: tetratricopeptide repeat protein, partial [Deltaproteobacteria bacterium]|nr:tetratricopeptide repeat protein [Deltaproteobacteria bacterium]
MSYAEEYDILKNSIKNIMPDMAMVRIETVSKAHELIESLNLQLKLPAFYNIEFQPNGVRAAVEILNKARDFSLISKEQDTEIIFIIDKGSLNVPEPDQIDFWETMNAQRELWGSLKAYIIFIMLPEEYDKMLIIAHHLTDWIPLKIDLLKKPDQKSFTDTQKIISDSSDGISGKTALSEIDNLLQSFKEAEKKRGKSLIRRFLLPAFDLAVDAFDMKRAAEIRKYIAEDKIQKADIMQWNRLNFKFYFYTSKNRKAAEYLLRFKKDAEQIQDKSKIAFSYLYTGMLKFRTSENKEALKSYEIALPIYKEIRNRLGEANCISSIGEIHLRESHNVEALKAYEAALSIYKEIRNRLGEANCISSIGEIHLRESHNVEA